MNDTTITITGNIGTPPEQKLTSAGVPFTRFRIACTERRFDRTAGAWTDGATSWYAVSMFRDLAEHAFRSLAKGDRVILTGRLRIRNWENGTTQGTDAEIEAEAIGHDLRWGTTTFDRARRPQAPLEQPGARSADAPPAGGPAEYEAEDVPATWNVPNSPAELREPDLAMTETPF